MEVACRHAHPFTEPGKKISSVNCPSNRNRASGLVRRPAARLAVRLHRDALGLYDIHKRWGDRHRHR